MSKAGSKGMAGMVMAIPIFMYFTEPRSHTSKGLPSGVAGGGGGGGVAQGARAPPLSFRAMTSYKRRPATHVVF